MKTKAERAKFALRSLSAGSTNAVVTNDVTAVELHVEVRGMDGCSFTVTGVAKRDPVDDFNPDTGAYLAMGRALEEASKVFLRKGKGLVKHADDMREQRTAAKLRPAQKAKPANDVRVLTANTPAKRAVKKASPKKKA